ncbi:hypothetical protein H5410_047513 [Solanum commersonii]|uniref:Uncharacterized protein n=1 Tax=Solanum commersonii TaxID=4109 RepID=A0A9J5XHI6_SOLCO|nr:hypothetical protein H5410_047513 [Solanum commersonii]
MAENGIEEMLDHLRRIKSGGNLTSFKIDQIQKFEMWLGVLRTFIKYHHVLFRDSLVKHTKNAKSTMEMLHRVLDGITDQCKTNLNLERLESHLLEFLKYKDEDEDKDDILNKHPYLLFLIVLVELEMKKIFLDELKAFKVYSFKNFQGQEITKRIFSSSPKSADVSRKQKAQ